MLTTCLLGFAITYPLNWPNLRLEVPKLRPYAPLLLERAWERFPT